MNRNKYNKESFIFFLTFIVISVSLFATFSIVRRIQIGESVLPQKSKAASQTTEHWFHPNYHYKFNHDLASSAWGSYFTNTSQTGNILNNINVYGLFVEQIEKNEGNFLQQLIPLLKSKNIKISTEGGPAKCKDNKLIDGAQWADYFLNTLLKPLYDAGGTVDYFSFSGFPAHTISRTSTPICTTNINESLPELVKFMKRFHEVHPETKFGLIINFPNYGYGNNISYWSNNEPWGDYKSHLEKILTAVDNAGEKLYYVHIDNPYDYAIGERPHTIQGIDWMQRIVDIEKQTKMHGLRFGLIVNSERGGIGYDKNSGNDKQFYDDSMAFLKEYYEKGGRLDSVIVESWYNHPSALFPDYTPYTMTYNALKAYQLYDSLTNGVKTVNRLKNESGITFIVMSATEQKSAIEKYGYKSPTPLFRAWESKNDANLHPVYRLFKANEGYLYTNGEKEKNNAISIYGYSLNGVAFYAYSRKINDSVPVYRLQLTNSDGGSRFLYTLSETEKNTLINNGNYKLNGIAFYALPP